MKKQLISILLTTFLTGCWQFDNDSKMLVGNYNIGWVDNVRWQTIMYNSSGHSGGSYEVDPYVFSVGHDEKYIIAKQHPICKDFIDNDCFPDQSVTNFFIINIASKEKYGPYSESEFNEKKKVLNIDDVNFTLNFPEIPHD